jgi:hypothetical protein
MTSVIIFIIFTNLTPCIPLSFRGEGEDIVREAPPLFDSPYSTFSKERGRLLKRGANTPRKDKREDMLCNDMLFKQRLNPLTSEVKAGSFNGKS